MSLNFEIKTFDNLTTKELYQVLKLRCEVFVLEQHCAYLDLDDLDQKSLHLLGRSEDKRIIAYARILPPKLCEMTHSSIGRVVVQPNKREKGHGRKLMIQAMNYCNSNHPELPIKISAQTYLSSFYQSLGFVNTGHFYLEDDIPHQEMVWFSK